MDAKELNQEFRDLWRKWVALKEEYSGDTTHWTREMWNDLSTQETDIANQLRSLYNSEDAQQKMNLTSFKITIVINGKLGGTAIPYHYLHHNIEL